ncbi:MAG: hypothetical protein A2X13_02395 [Bacteroidetes bacterium GWC2_33_15]|nr:MAG: hypothetical protein A2X10_14840 [Bacteroidetes bacterium GWA2_33_15]OFX49346.1 MAG: hypothetical protein A2X13_02395 [Bacteroidetes bacterium GWC2_33_15]OFX63061.1 MAG: hypothetical protein A2X15_10475 [Bacteroidetes bacterium GWB2_32_14]OFX68694.1 MAG: hypothetical protein A2X14_13920 [Bacteroidetes bacterium GWD2_33_33]HAN19140.1 hypothetical protein [Bacteroidales bacterium]
MKNSFIFIFCLIIFTLSIPGYGQIQEKNSTYIFYKNTSAIPEIVLPSINISKLLSEDKIHEQTGLKSMRYAEIIDIDVDPAENGEWEILQTGDKIWNIKIKSPEAYSLGVYFDKYRLPVGAKLFIYNPDKTHILGAFTYKNNKTDNILATAPVKGDEIIIEYFEPENVDFKGEFHISSIAHDYKNIFEHLTKDTKGFGSSGDCNVDINCTDGDEWQLHKHSVCKITQNGWLCTGALINNTNFDGNPFLLTAQHCIDQAYEASAAIFYFNYESPECNGIDGPTDQTLSGSTIIATSANNSLDFTLLELSSEPPAAYFPYYAGWNRNISDPTSATSIHHPSGDVKKITKSLDGATTGNYETDYSSFTHWWIDAWDSGTTEGGSSGSPLFDQNKRIIGDLTGGDANCVYNFNDYYQQFHHSWQNSDNINNQLKAWLDPQNSGLIELDGFLPYDTMPSNLKASVADTIIKLYWNEPTNSAEINSYYIYRNSVKFDSTINTNYIDSFAFKGTINSYWITVKYNDPGKKESAKSNTITVRTMDALSLPYVQLFDSNFIPSDFYEEQTNDTVGWEFKSGGYAGYLDTAFEGIYNAYFYSTSGEKSKLILPKFNLGTTNNALLSFYLNLDSIGDKAHKLKILYRGNDSLSWKEIKSFENPKTGWQKVFVSLPGNSENTQIAFEGYGLHGYGISIDSILIAEDTKFVSVEFSSDRDTVCTLDTILFSTSLDNSYDLSWDFGETAIPKTATGIGPHKIVYTTPGLKPVTLIANNTYIKYIPDFIKVFGFSNLPDFTVSGNILTSTSPYGNQWFLNDEIIPGAVSKTYTILQDGDYSLEVTNFAGCTETSEVKHLILNSISQIDNPETNFQIFPNPNPGNFTLILDNDLTKYSGAIIRIINITGNIVHEERINTNEINKEIQLYSVPKGVYIIQIIFNNKTLSQKLLIS